MKRFSLCRLKIRPDHIGVKKLLGYSAWMVLLEDLSPT